MIPSSWPTGPICSLRNILYASIFCATRCFCLALFQLQNRKTYIWRELFSDDRPRLAQARPRSSMIWLLQIPHTKHARSQPQLATAAACIIHLLYHTCLTCILHTSHHTSIFLLRCSSAREANYRLSPALFLLLLRCGAIRRESYGGDVVRHPTGNRVHTMLSKSTLSINRPAATLAYI